MSSKTKCPVSPTDATVEVTLVYPFSEEEYRKGIAALKNGKSAGIDDVLVKQLNNQRPTLSNWLRDMLNENFTEDKVPRLWRQSMFNVRLKQYKPISLLCHMYERLILK